MLFEVQTVWSCWPVLYYTHCTVSLLQLASRHNKPTHSRCLYTTRTCHNTCIHQIISYYSLCIWVYVFPNGQLTIKWMSLSIVPGFNGTNCENNIDDCPGHQCANGGTCMDGVNTYNCQCPPEWTGKGFVCVIVYVFTWPLLYPVFVHAGLLWCHVQYVGFPSQCLKSMQDIRGFPRVSEVDLWLKIA